MDNQRLLKLQAERGAKVAGYVVAYKTIDFVIRECRRFIQDRAENYRELDSARKQESIKELIISYVMSHPHIVEGYVDEDNKPDTNKLVDKLIEEITNYGILTSAMIDPSIYEIRCNGKEIKVEIQGRVKDLKDKDGNVLSFDSVEQQDIVLRKLLGDVRLTPKDALVNARTVEGYRIAANHNSTMSPDPWNPTEDKYHSFVLRKFRKSKLTLSDIVKYKSMSDNMARFLTLTAQGGLTTICAGPTASGKTSLLNALLRSVPPTSRVVLLQNPSEIDIRHRDNSDRVFNDVLHLEATDKDSGSTHDATMENLMAQTLRLSPTYVCLGEIRTNKEFAMGMMIMGAGHPLFASLHAKSSMGVMNRYLRGYMAASNESRDTALPGLTDVLDIIVVQKIMKDGTRKVLQITEVQGVDTATGEAKLNDLYIFKTTGRAVYDSNGDIIDIPGVHKRVGKLSEETIETLKREGIPESRFDFLLKEPSGEEIETYTGENIERYGM